MELESNKAPSASVHATLFDAEIREPRPELPAEQTVYEGVDTAVGRAEPLSKRDDDLRQRVAGDCAAPLRWRRTST